MSDERAPFRLKPHQVPELPVSSYYRDLLRWCVMVMDDDDPQLDFAASMLSRAVKEGTLTKKQSTWADKIVDLVTRAYEQGRLECQQPTQEVSQSRGSGPPDLLVVKPEGNA